MAKDKSSKQSLDTIISRNNNDKSAIWVTDFSQDSVIDFYDSFTEMEKDTEIQVIPVFISSYGGEVYALTAMRDLIKSSHKPVATIAVGMAMSAAASLLASGTKGCRFASPDAHIMIHQVSGMAPGKTADVVESAAVISALNRLLLQNLAKDSGNSLKKIEKAITSKNNADWTLTAEDAKSWGIVDHIGIPRLLKESSPMILIQTKPFAQKKSSTPKGHKKP